MLQQELELVAQLAQALRFECALGFFQDVDDFAHRLEQLGAPGQFISWQGCSLTEWPVSARPSWSRSTSEPITLRRVRERNMSTAGPSTWGPRGALLSPSNSRRQSRSRCSALSRAR